jgi:hypothetical protein
MIWMLLTMKQLNRIEPTTNPSNLGRDWFQKIHELTPDRVQNPREKTMK